LRRSYGLKRAPQISDQIICILNRKVKQNERLKESEKEQKDQLAE